MQSFTRRLFITATTMGLALGGSAIAATQDKDRKGKGDSNVAAVAVLLAPMTFGTDEKLGNGCWARLYDGQNFNGNMLTLVGPVEMPNMRTAFGTDWSGSFDSVVTGPKETVNVYDNENYGQKSATFTAGQRVPDLDAKLGLFEQIRSMKITCST